MLDYARQRAEQALRAARSAVLATTGPAGIQIDEVECQAAGVILYLLVPGTSDHLFNLEHNSAVRLLAAGWQAKGQAEIVPNDEQARALELLQRVGARWCVLVRVDPAQIQLRRPDGWGTLETLDLNGNSAP